MMKVGSIFSLPIIRSKISITKCSCGYDFLSIFHDQFQSMMQNYDTEALKLAKAIDIAIYCFRKHPPEEFTKEHIDHFVNVYSEWKDRILNPEPEFRKMASLKYDIQNVFTVYQEGSGEAVEHFWQQIANENLGYIREDKLRKIVNRGKIRGRSEYDLVVDSIVSAEQENRISKDEALQLDRMLDEYELRGKRNK